MIFCWLALALAAPAAPAPTAEEREYQVKGAFLAKFALFTEWPAGAFTNATAPIVLGVLGPDRFGPEFETALKGQAANGRPFILRRIRGKGGLAGCHILFVSAAARVKAAEVTALTGSAPILTVGETGEFAARGGMINFFKDEGRVRFEINVDAAARAHLKISAKLLQLARIVRDAPEGTPAPGKK
ncbi:MAG: YfiR family protein [Verrucomicrobia bacterium]|nr:YfiR family protein [Verrucomicrobiota bacterium]